jgi:GTP-binding protein EngB required for normal cell division
LENGPTSDPVKEQIEQTHAELAERRDTPRPAGPSARNEARVTPRWEAKSAPSSGAAEGATTEPPQQPPPRSSAAAAVVQTPAPAPKVVNLQDFENLLKKRMRAVVICGASHAGKSEIARGFTRAAEVYRGQNTAVTLGGTAGVTYNIALGGTSPGTVWYQLIDGRRVFLDPSGEFFQRFSTRYRTAQGLGDITEAQFDFVRSAVRKLAGVVLAFDLSNREPNAGSPWAEQQAIAATTLSVIRWLRYDRRTRYKDLNLMDRMTLYLKKHPKRLDVPVLVLFSKADRLAELTNEHPLALLRRELTTLHAALLTNARKFRVDYAHTMVKGSDGIDRPAKYPCGVLLPIEWLLGGPLRRLRPLPTSFLGGGK